jgi:5S rRNA maturation endonuclease (ribonuclease M5)
MNTCNILTSETLQQAARRFSKPAIEKGFKPEALHSYKDQNGTDVYHRIRLKHPNGDKWIRPIYMDSDGQYQLGEPPECKGLPKLLYGLPLPDQYKEAIVCVVEGEWPADKLNKFFSDQGVSEKYIAITSGSATSAAGADWQPLAGRTCILWADNDEPGENYTRQVAEALASLGCSIKYIDIDVLQLPEGGDCVDWLK